MALLTFPWPQLLDASGDTYPGAKLYFYETGTSTLATVYTDAALTTPHTNPVIADATGTFAPIYLGNKSYKVVLKSSGDVTLFSADPVTGSGESNVASYAALRALRSPTNGQRAWVTGEGVAGLFVFDSSEGNADNGGTIIDPTDGTTGAWVRRYDGPVNVKWFGAVGDGSTNDTEALQDALDAATDIFIPPGDYRVYKTALFSADFPNGDQPCLFVKSKSGYKITGGGDARLVVNEHAQGILEIQSSSDVVIDGVAFIGPGDFPDLDGTTGRGEKGSVTEGYDTSSIWGSYKNNSSNTSANTGGGFSGAFPQYAGGTAGTWGTWNDGYIGNVAYGLLIQKACDNITVRSCYVSGFNYCGFSVGHKGDSAYTKSTNVNFIDCTAEDCYSAGINTFGVDGGGVYNCKIAGIGHPDATPATDTYSDPGYGYTARAGSTLTTENFKVIGNTVKSCVRKGIDSHKSDRLVIEGNTIEDCGAGGIFAAWTGTTGPVRGTTIRGNLITNSGYAANDLGAIYIGGCIDANYSYANILLDCTVTDNIIRDCGGQDQIRMLNGRNVVIARNTIRGVDSRYTGTSYGMYLGRAGETSYHINVSDNIIDADTDIKLTRGITMLATDDSVCNNNIVRIDHASAQEGIRANSCLKTDFSGNRVYMDAGAATCVPLSLALTDGVCSYNYSDPDVGAGSFPISAETTAGVKEQAYRVPHVIQLDITFNGTTSPAFTVNAGSDYVDTVGELATYGALVTFKNIQSSAILRSSIVNKSADGLEAAAGDITFIYERALTHNGMEIGLKTDASGTDIIASNCTGGTISVLVFVF